LHAGLTRVDPATLRPVPYLARELVWSGPLTLDVALRPGLRFHGGAPFGAPDVVATLHAFASPKVGSRHATTVEPIAEVVATAPLSVRIVLKRPHATLLSDLELPMLRRDQADGPPDPAGEALDGLGPYELERGVRGELDLRPSHDGVRQDAPARERLAVRTVHDENARAVRLYSGRADVAQGGISPTLLPALEGNAGLLLATSHGANLTYLVARVDHGPLADVRLRRAISLAIDRQTLADYLFGGRATPAESVLPDGHWARRAPSPDEPTVRFDLAAARAIVSAMPGPPRRLTLLTSTDRLRVTVARTMAEGLGGAGIDVDVVPLELGTLIARLNAGDFDLASLQLPELTEPNVLRVFLHSAYVPPAGSNRGRVRDAELDAWLDLGDAATDDSARARAYAGVDARIHDQLFIIPLWHEDQVAVVSPRARGYQPTPDGRWLSLADLP
jgi:peptide/nickel transport system substrate-binding protein